MKRTNVAGRYTSATEALRSIRAPVIYPALLMGTRFPAIRTKNPKATMAALITIAVPVVTSVFSIELTGSGPLFRSRLYLAVKWIE